MRIELYRLAQRRYQNEAYSGFGGMVRKGRWHKRGHEVVYSSVSRSLCVLESLVRVDPEDLPESVIVPAQVSAAIFRKRIIFKVEDLPQNWRISPSPSVLQEIGMDWLEGEKSAILEVPSVIIPEEKNYLLNPNHPDFMKIKVLKPSPFVFDPRLFK